MYIKYFELVF